MSRGYGYADGNEADLWAVPRFRAEPSVVSSVWGWAPLQSWARAEDTTASERSRYRSVRFLSHPPDPSSVCDSSHNFLIAKQCANDAAAVIAADRASNAFDISHNPEKQREIERERHREQIYNANKSAMTRAKDWASENRYPLLFGFWVASMAGSWIAVNRSPMSGAQKLVQARMYAQGLTLSALLASFAFEGNDAAKGKGRWETITVLDPNDPEHKHMIEKKIHHERYAGEDQWRGTFAASVISSCREAMCEAWRYGFLFREHG